jgi:glycerophosphoryl diester phosphodiesterase
VTIVIAHRGASARAPENSVEAFELAVGLGADAVELDVRRTADGRAVVNHDPDVVVDGVSRPIVSFGRSDLPGGVIDLDTALDACRGVRVNIEIKNWREDPDHDPGCALADEVCRILSRRDEPVGRWFVSSFDLATIDRVRALRPDVATAYLTAGDPDRDLDAVIASGHPLWHPWFGVVTTAHIRRAHLAGIGVNVWTCDDPDAIDRLLAAGVDGICTNVPDVALARRARSITPG